MNAGRFRTSAAMTIRFRQRGRRRDEEQSGAGYGRIIGVRGKSPIALPRQSFGAREFLTVDRHPDIKRHPEIVRGRLVVNSAEGMDWMTLHVEVLAHQSSRADGPATCRTTES